MKKEVFEVVGVKVGKMLFEIVDLMCVIIELF